MLTYRITFGKSTHTYYTPYHAEQFARALRLNGTPHKLELQRAARERAQRIRAARLSS